VRICREEIQPAIVPFIDRVAFDNGRRIVALDVEGKRRPYRTREGRYYMRIGSEKRGGLGGKTSRRCWMTARPVVSRMCVRRSNATFADIDESLLWSFVREFAGDAFDEASANGYPTRSVLERDLLLTAALGGDLVPSVAGVLLFGRATKESRRFCLDQRWWPLALPALQCRLRLLNAYNLAATC